MLKGSRYTVSMNIVGIGILFKQYSPLQPQVGNNINLRRGKNTEFDLETKKRFFIDNV